MEARHRKLVLLVEDDPVSLKLMRDVLEPRGHQTDAATSGEEALEKAVALSPDLIVMDVRLPRMSGLEATQLLKGDPATRSIPVLAVTAHAMPGDEDRILEAGCAAYLPKPLVFSRFVSLVDSLIS